LHPLARRGQSYFYWDTVLELHKFYITVNAVRARKRPENGIGG
jgi:hypothetical protein